MMAALENKMAALPLEKKRTGAELKQLRAEVAKLQAANSSSTAHESSMNPPQKLPRGEQYQSEDYAAYRALSHHGVYSERNAKLLREVNDLLRQLALVQGKVTKSKSLTKPPEVQDPPPNNKRKVTTRPPPRPLRGEEHEDLGHRFELEREIERVRATIKSSEKQLHRIRHTTGREPRDTEDRKGGQSLLRMRADINSMATRLRMLRRTRENGPPGGNADVAPASAMDAVHGDDLHSTAKEKSVRRKRHTTGRNTEERKGGHFLQKVRADIKSIHAQLESRIQKNEGGTTDEAPAPAPTTKD
jgi:hypothetical protein